MDLSNASKIKLDVGGKIFCTSKDTLLAEQGTFFEGLLSMQMGPQTGPDGTYFLDRNPKPYTYIFDYLRKGRNTFVPPKDPEIIRMLKEEAEFLCMEELVSLLSSARPLMVDFFSEEDKRPHHRIICPNAPQRCSGSNDPTGWTYAPVEHPITTSHMSIYNWDKRMYVCKKCKLQYGVYACPE